MRKYLILALSLAFLGSSGVAFAAEPTAVGELKGVRGRDQGEQVRTYKLVRYVQQAQDGASIVSGDAVVYSTVSDDGISVTLTTTSADGAFAGIAVTTILTSDVVQNNVNDGRGARNWGYILVHGMTTANITAGGGNAGAVGSIFITSTDSGKITALEAGNGLNSVSNNGLNRAIAGRGGFLYDSLASDATSTTVEVQVDKE